MAKNDDHAGVSEVTRSIFADTWRSYVDEPAMSVVNFEKKFYSGIKTGIKKVVKVEVQPLKLV